MSGPTLTRSDREVEAESVAYLLCGSHGLASDDYSFGYVATWASGDPPTSSDMAMMRWSTSR